MKFINDYTNKFQIVWDLGRRCTYACSYCPPHRNNKTSRLVELDELIETMDFIDEYFSMYQEFRTEHNKLIPSLSFTGGEPTIHPDFFKFAVYVKQTYGDKYNFNLTTNGAFSGKTLKMVEENIDGGTISYHPESTEIQKQMVRNTIWRLGHKFRVNVMFSKYHFDECIELCKDLSKEGIKFTPRRIGDDGGSQTSIDKGYTHIYTEEQEEYFNSFFGTKSAKCGRSCCGMRKLGTECGTTQYIDDTNFQGWHCGVNWQFLYLNSETRHVWTHQTCMVNLDGEVAPLGHLDDPGKMLDDLQNKLYEPGGFPVIRCPKKFCGCGMCADKSTDFDKYVDLQEDKVKRLKFKEVDQVKPLPERNPYTVIMEQIDATKEV